MPHWILRILLVFLLLALLASAAAWLLLRGSLATLDGDVELPGLSAPAVLERDADGSVTIEAATASDAYRALGFAHAQERYFEMDLMRRSAAGELAALFGEVALDHDRGMRPHRLRTRAEAAVAAASAAERAEVQAYVDGVNAGLDALSVRPWPYLLLWSEPQPWRADDTVLVALAMFTDLHDEANRRELALARLQPFVSPEVFALLLRDGTPWDAPLFGEPRNAAQLPPSLRHIEADTLHAHEAPSPAAPSGTLENMDVFPRGLHGRTRARSRTVRPAAEPPSGAHPLALFADAQTHPRMSDLTPGSNNFAVSGALTADGNALVANDMHLGLRVPALWLKSRLRYADAAAPDGQVDVAGVSLPGVPGVIAGSNGHVAWGFTNSYGDWLDWFEVQWLDAERTRYRTADGEAAAVRVKERIVVAGGVDEVLTVVETLWGPVLAEASDTTSLALAWTAHRTGAVDLGLLQMARAGDVDKAMTVAQAAGMPVQNLVVGDAGGRIAWTLAGRIPRRLGGCDPGLPMDPLDGCDWDGWLAPAEVPSLPDPPQGRLWTANARVVDGAALDLVGDGGYALGARQQQIRDALFARQRFDEQALLDLQLDDRALFLERWWVLLRAVLEAPGADADPLLAALSDASAVWNGRAAVDSASYRITRAFRLAVHEALLEQVFAAAEAAMGGDFEAPSLPQFEGLAWAVVDQRPPQFPQGQALDVDALLADAAREVAGSLREQGGDLSLHTWGERNRARIVHPLSAALPWFLARRLDMPADPLPGDAHMPRVQGPAFGASERFVVAPGQERRGLMHLPGGPTGHPLSPFHGAGHDDWVHGRPSPFLPGPARHRLVLDSPGP